jgi:glutathione S-transferase
MYTLYALNGAGSVATEALLAELDLPCTVTELERGPDKEMPAWFKAINPRAEVPTLKLPDGSIMTESAAQMIYLADLHPEANLAPLPTDPRRAHYLRTIVFMATVAYTADLRMYYSERFSTEPAHAPAIKAKATSDLAVCMAQFSASLGKGPYVLGETFSAADIYCAMLATWVPDFTALVKTYPNIGELYKRVAARPKIEACWKRNAMPALT